MLSHCIIDTKTSALSGWVLLGLYFNLNKRYITAIHVLEYTKSLTSLGQFSVSIDSHISIRDMLSNTNREYGFLNMLLHTTLNHVDNPDVLICHLIDGNK
jgi:hypothetical protein